MNSFLDSFNVIKLMNDHKRDSGLRSMVWFPNLSYGWYPVIDDGIYNDAYVAEYQKYRETSMGRAITDFRVSTVRSYIDSESDLIDIGIGAGQFFDEYSKNGKILGYDVSDFGINYLSKRDRFIDIRRFRELSNLCFWDSLEHIHDCWRILQAVRDGCFVFMTVPLVANHSQALKSKHFKPSEHYWYFTREGLVAFMIFLGFDWISESDTEASLGREEVSTFVFRKRKQM